MRLFTKWIGLLVPIRWLTWKYTSGDDDNRKGWSLRGLKRRFIAIAALVHR